MKASTTSRRIALAMICFVFLLIGTVPHSHAFRIVTPYSSVTDYDWGSGGWHVRYIETDKTLNYVDWYVNGIYDSTSLLPAGTTFDVFTGYLSGSLIGSRYTIKVVA